MLRAASSRLGIGAFSAMKIAENLYLAGYVSYPRTESTAFPVSCHMRQLPYAAAPAAPASHTAFPLSQLWRISVYAFPL